MLRTAMIVTAAILASASGAAAGQCSEGIAALERSVAALQQVQANTGATAPNQAGSTGKDTAVAQSTQAVQQAKELDRQGKEAECMQVLKQAKGWPPQSE
jgi:hypothetical protein